MENNTTTATPETKELLKIHFSKHAPFESTGETKLTNTTELAKLINDVFSQVFNDYYGCALSCQFQPERGAYIVVPKLYFHVLKKEDYDADGYFAFKPLSSQPQNDMVGRVQRLSQISTTSGIKVAITDDAKSVLEDFVISPAVKNQKFDWQTAYNTYATDSEAFIYVFKLDIMKLLKLIFGDKDETTGSDLYYQITPMYMLGANTQYKTPDNWAVSVMRLNYLNEVKAAELYGFGTPTQTVGPVVITDKTNK